MKVDIKNVEACTRAEARERDTEREDPIES